MKKTIFNIIDIPLFISVLLLTGVGIIFIYSSGINSSGVQVSNEFFKQIIFAATGIIWMFAASLVDYRSVYRYAPHCFAGLAVLLLYTVFLDAT